MPSSDLEMSNVEMSSTSNAVMNSGDAVGSFGRQSKDSSVLKKRLRLEVDAVEGEIESDFNRALGKTCTTFQSISSLNGTLQNNYS